MGGAVCWASAAYPWIEFNHLIQTVNRDLFIPPCVASTFRWRHVRVGGDVSGDGSAPLDAVDDECNILVYGQFVEWTVHEVLGIDCVDCRNELIPDGPRITIDDDRLLYLPVAKELLTKTRDGRTGLDVPLQHVEDFVNPRTTLHGDVDVVIAEDERLSHVIENVLPQFPCMVTNFVWKHPDFS